MENQTSANHLCQILRCQASTTDFISFLRSLSETDWEELYAYALMQGLVLILHQTLQEYKDHVEMPEAIMVKLRQQYLHSLGRNLRILNQFGKILTILNNNNIPVIGLKGIYLVENVYKNIGFRTFCDLDLMVPKDKLSTTLNCLEDIGFKLSTYFDLNDINRDIKHIPPMTQKKGLTIEVHWTILEEDEPFTIDAEGLWQRAIPTQIAGVDTLALCNEDLILHLCTHMAYQHHLTLGLRDLYDLYTVLTRYENQIDWETLIRIAKSWGVERVVGISFKLLKELLDYQTPDGFINTILDEEIPAEIMESAITYLLDDGQSSNNLTPDLIRLSDKNGVFPKIRLILSRIFIKKQTLARAYNIPANSGRIYLYYIQRFIDLFKQYAGSAWHLMIRNNSALADIHNLDRNVQLVNWLAKNERTTTL